MSDPGPTSGVDDEPTAEPEDEPRTGPDTGRSDGPAGDVGDAGTGTSAPPTGGDDEHTWGWHYTRVSALFLAVLLPVHFARTFLVTDIARVSARAMSDRWADPAARALDGAAIILALTHGAAAIAPRLAAARSSAVAARRVAVAVWVVLGGLAAAVALVVLTYDLSLT